MTTLLQINASLHNGNGQSSQLANQFIAAFQRSHPGTKILTRDVAATDPVPHLSGERFRAFIAKPEARTVAEHSVVAYSDNLIDELKQADGEELTPSVLDSKFVRLTGAVGRRGKAPTSS